MKDSQTILKRLENLLQPKSVILTSLYEKRDKNNNTIAKKNKAIAEKQEKIAKLNKDIATLNEENETLVSTLTPIKDNDFKLIISTLKLNINIKETLNKLANHLPLQITIRQNDIKDITSSIEEDNKKVAECTEENNTLEKDITVALLNQEKLTSLVKEALSGDVKRNRDEVTSILTSVEFTPAEAISAAKLIMFPEDELIPFFKDFTFPEIESKEESKTDSNEHNSLSDFNIFNITFDNEKGSADEETGSSPVAVPNEPEDEPTKTDDEPISLNEDNETFANILEDETPISFEELKQAFMSSDDEAEEPDKEIADTLEDIALNLENLTSATEEKNEPIEESNVNDDAEISANPEESEAELNSEPENTEQETKDETPASKLDLSFLDKSLEDLALVNITSADVDENKLKETINSNAIDTSSISLTIYKYGLDNYLENINILKNNGYNPTTMELEKFGISLALVTPTELQAKLKVLNDYKIDLKMPNGKLALKVLCVPTEKLVDKLDAIIECQENNLLIYDVNVLSKNVTNIIECIMFCKKYGIPYTEEKNNILVYRPYVYSESSLEKLVEKKVDLNLLPTKEESNKKLVDYLNQEVLSCLTDANQSLLTVKLNNATAFDKFTALEQKLESTFMVKGNAYIINGSAFSVQNTKRNLIVLANSNLTASTCELLTSALFFNSGKDVTNIAKVKESIGEE